MTPQEAVDAIYGVHKVAWELAFPAAPILYFGIPNQSPIDPSTELWSRATIRHNLSFQSSLTDASHGCKRYQRRGIVTVQVFGKIGDGSVIAYNAADVVLKAYEDAKLPVWFRNVSLKEVGEDGPYEQINVTAEFIYDQARGN